MARVKSLDDLKRMRQYFQRAIRLRENSNHPEKRIQIKVSMATCGIAAGAKETMMCLIEELDKLDLDAVVIQTGCMGYCYAEPTIEVHVPGSNAVVYGNVDKHRAKEIVEKHIQGGKLVAGIVPIVSSVSLHKE